MSIKVRIDDSRGTGKSAFVNDFGQLVVGQNNVSDTFSITANVINTAFNLITPSQNQRFIITDVLLYANKDVGATDATVVLYEATAPDSTTVQKTILNIEMLKQSNRDLVGLNLGLSEGVWLNIKTNDNSVFATVMGYYVDV